jgi:preprotein translocase subunit SecG
MSWLNNLLMIAQVLSALGVIVLVLMQHGKGADMGAAFGSGSSGSLFGASGSASFLSRSTGMLATVFFVSTLALALLANPRSHAPTSVMEGAGQSTQPSDVPPGSPSDIPPSSPSNQPSGVPGSSDASGANTVPGTGSANGQAQDVPK